MNMNKLSLLEKTGLTLRNKRRKLKLSQFALSNNCQISRNQISEIERGKINITINTLLKLCTALHIPVRRIFY